MKYPDPLEYPPDEAVEWALRHQDLADPPPSLAANVLQRIADLPRAQADIVNWPIVVLAAGTAIIMLVSGLLVLADRVRYLVTPENLLLVRLEVWYWNQRLLFDWLALLARVQNNGRFALPPGPTLLLASLLGAAFGALILIIFASLAANWSSSKQSGAGR